MFVMLKYPFLFSAQTSYIITFFTFICGRRCLPTFSRGSYSSPEIVINTVVYAKDCRDYQLGENILVLGSHQDGLPALN